MSTYHKQQSSCRTSLLLLDAASSS